MVRARYFINRHRTFLSWICFLSAIVLIFWTVNNPAIVGASAVKRSLPIYSVEREDKTVAISFDAAWGNEDTQALIDILDEYNVKTTFFVVADWVDKYPESVKALSDAGHEVMNHSTSHSHFSKMSTAEIQNDIMNCNDKVKAVTGVSPTLFRCPYGEYDDHVIEAVRAIGMNAIQWSVDSLDWKGISADEISERVINKIEPGSIVLFHNAAEHTPEALPRILKALQEDGYTIVPVSQLILSGDYTIDHTGKQIAAK